jgi:hypothetical protein
MWDSLLILIGLHPILATLLPLSLGSLLLLLKGRHLPLVCGCIMVLLSISLGGTLHFRWDSFSIHFSKLPNDSFPEKLSVLFVGDSITCEGSRPRGFISKIRSVLPIEHQIVCQKGATSIEIVDLLEQTSVEHDPAFIIAQSGINDLLSCGSEDQVFRWQEMLLEKLSAKFPHSKVYFMPIHPLKLSNVNISKLPSHGPANFPAWWTDYSSFAQDFLLADGVHLNAHGHTKMALALISEILNFPFDENLNEITL